MAVLIRNLHCTVRVRGARKASLLHQTEAPQRPGLAFVMPVNSAKAAMGAASQMDEHDDETPENTPTRPNLATMDSRVVADRVYDLMREETRMGRLRLGRK